MLINPAFRLPLIISDLGGTADPFAGLGGALHGGVGMVALFAMLGVGFAVMMFFLDDESDDEEVDVVLDTGQGVDILGTLGPDRLFGTPGDDMIEGLDGDDDLYGEYGDDVIMGQADQDILVGDAGNDTLFGGSGADILGPNGLFQTREDHFAEMEGDDTLFGGWGVDTLFDMRGTNTIYGGDNGDEIDVRDSRERLDTTNLTGAPRTPDLVYGGTGPDVIRIDDGDIAFGGLGGDDFTFDMLTNAVNDLEEDYVTIGDWEVERDILRIHDPNGIYESFGEYTLLPAPEEDGIWVVLGETRLALLLGNGSVVSEMQPSIDGGRIIIAAPFSR